MRTNSRNSPSVDANAPAATGSTIDLATLDAEARAHAERWSRPKAKIAGLEPRVLLGGRRFATPTADVATKALVERSMFRRMLDSFFGVSYRH